MGATHGVDIPFTLGNAINRFAGRSHVSERGTNAAPVAPLDDALPGAACGGVWCLRLGR